MHDVVAHPMTEFTLNARAFSIKVQLAAPPGGRATPTLSVTARARAEHRKLRALLHLLATIAELRTPLGERWVIQTRLLGDTRGRLELELLHGTEAESGRAMKLLDDVALALSSDGVSLRFAV